MTASATERLVASVWAQTFQSAEPGPDDDFLLVGGHSLLAMRMVAALSERTGRRIAVEDVFAGRTPTGLAARVDLAPPHLVDGDGVPTAAIPALSPAQHRLWFVEQLTPGMSAHNIAMVEQLSGRLDIVALRSALGHVAERQEALRWRITQSGGVPAVVVDPPADAALPVDDLADRPPAERDAALIGLLEAETGTPFDLAAGPLWRVRLIRLAPDRHVLSITIHHIVFDGWSRKVLYQDLARAYQDAMLGRDHVSPPLPATFADYVAWLARRSAAAAELAHWTGYLHRASTVLDLPRDRPRPVPQTFRGARCSAVFDRVASARLRAVAAQARATPAAALLAIFGQLLRRLTGQHDFIVGIPVADRGNVAFAPLVGFCVQVLPVRMRVTDDGDFREHVGRCHAQITAALAHPDLPLERIMEDLAGVRDLSRSPLIQVLFNMYDFTEPYLDLPGITAQPMTPGLPGSLFDLTLYVSDHDEQIAVQVTYNPDLYDEARVEAMLAGYRNLLDELTAEPGRPVRSASLRPAHSDLPGWHTPLPDWDGPGLLERVHERLAADPAAMAITGAGGELGNADVRRICAGTANAIRAAGAAPGRPVAVLAARDVRLAPVLLGVLATGCRWVILDPAWPPAILARQLTAVHARILIRFPGIADPDPGQSGRTLLDVTDLAAGEPTVPYEAPADRGYLSLTSGTTGAHKQIITPERPLAHFLDWYPRTFGLGPADRFALLAGLAHDPLLRDLFTPLVLGARSHVPEQAWLRDPARLLTWLREEQITVVHLTPQLGRLITATGQGNTLPALRLIALGGDRASYADARALRDLAPRARIVNFYGTTETPQAQAYHEVTIDGDEADPGGQPLPVGRGIDGAQILVLDATGRPAGVGEFGEVALRSRYLATGYADAALTRQRFTAAPGAIGSDRVFRTGDLGRYLPDGAVVLTGRADDQVKIRGFRVELGEVEAALMAHRDIRVACVTAPDDNGERLLHAYAVPARSGVHARQLHDHLRAHLPEYAVPANIILLSVLPLTPNGKVDRAALGKLGLPPRRRVEELVGRTERVIAGVWCEVLGLPRLGATDNFFDVGGHSLALVAIQAKLTALLDRPVPVIALFRYPSIRALAAHLDGAGRDDELDRAARRVAQRRQRARIRDGTHTTDRGDRTWPEPATRTTGRHPPPSRSR